MPISPVSIYSFTITSFTTCFVSFIILFIFFFLLIPLPLSFFFFFFNDTATTEIYTLSLHDALPIFPGGSGKVEAAGAKSLCEKDAVPLGPEIIHSVTNPIPRLTGAIHVYGGDFFNRSEEHTSELQSLTNLVCRLLLEKKKKSMIISRANSINQKNPPARTPEDVLVPPITSRMASKPHLLTFVNFNYAAIKYKTHPSLY